ncbi:hypothetical protein A5819_003589 [Enterococcus sp. 7E2_DIV0204]|nr:hypothetical protein A5819_003589 [Enterococcus sp. 7E2_DIV0204]OTP47178.1 hypothetical protein A5884_003553 [Enterococcus sp. 7D2_DIV0200]
MLGITGRIQTRNYQNQQGQRVYVTEVVCDTFQLLESRSTSEQRATENNHYNQTQFNNANTQPTDYEQQNFDKNVDSFSGNGATIDISDDDLPF